LIPEIYLSGIFLSIVMKLLTVIFYTVSLFLFPPLLTAQEVLNPSSRVQALAGSSVALSDCWSVFGNQAGMAGVNRLTIGGSFLNQFLVNELSNRAGFLAFPIQSSVFAVSLSQFGESPFRREKFGLAYARHITDKLSFGMQFNYYRLLFPEDNHMVGSSGLELGIQYLMNKQLVLGVHWINPYRTKIKLYTGYFQYGSLIAIGALYHFSESFSLISELENGFANHFTMRTGMEYNIRDRIILRGGVSGKPYQLSAGFGFQVEKLLVDLSTSYNQYLGNSPSVSFQFRF
jgi:hypothetical protein